MRGTSMLIWCQSASSRPLVRGLLVDGREVEEGGLLDWEKAEATPSR